MYQAPDLMATTGGRLDHISLGPSPMSSAVTCARRPPWLPTGPPRTYIYYSFTFIYYIDHYQSTSISPNYNITNNNVGTPRSPCHPPPPGDPEGPRSLPSCPATFRPNYTVSRAPEPELLHQCGVAPSSPSPQNTCQSPTDGKTLAAGEYVAGYRRLHYTPSHPNQVKSTDGHY